MPELAVVGNFSGMENMRTEVTRARDVPEEVWYALRDVHIESLKSELPQDEWDRVEQIIQPYDAYRLTRVHPNIYKPVGWNDAQLFTKNLVAVTYLNHEPVAAVLAQLNTSGSSSRRVALDMAEAAAKMIAPDRIPILGGKKHVQIREGYYLPGIQKELETPEDVTEVNGLMLGGMYLVLREHRRNRQAASYVLPSDSADAVMVRTVAALNMLPAEGDEGTPNKLPGYQRGARIVRVASGVSNVMAKSLESPGARMAINKISYGAVDRDEMSQAA